MRGSTMCFVALVSAGMITTASAAVTAVSGVTASANGWDTRTEGYGCAPNGCVPANAVDDSVEPDSRWSCNAELSGVDACELTLALDTPTDIVELRIAMWKGDTRTRALNILVDGALASTIESSGTTEGYEAYDLTAVEALTVVLQASDMEGNGWLSILGVQVMVDSEVDMSPRSPAPTPAPSIPDSAVTPAPTPSISDSGCPSNSIQSSLEITLRWKGDADLDLRVQEPGGEEVFDANRLGDVGMMSNDWFDDPGSETFILLNGLSITDDVVLGDYEAWITKFNTGVGAEWVLTARSGGVLLWTATGVVPDEFYNGEADRYTATVTEYTESDCSIDAYGNCPPGALSPDGLPPCTSCPSGDVSSQGATFCTLGALQFVDVSDELYNAIAADAVGGFAGPGSVDLDGDLDIYDRFLVDADDAGAIEFSGTFERDDEATLPVSTALFVYLVDDDADTFVPSDGDVDYLTGQFTVTVNDVPIGLSRVILSFAVIDPADTPDEQGADTVFSLDVVNSGCSGPLTITLEWNTDEDDFDLIVIEPSGNTVYPGNSGDFGFSTSDISDGFGPETYTLYGGDASANGEYSVYVQSGFVRIETTWTLTARVNGEVAWIEEGLFTPMEFSPSFEYDDTSTSMSDIFTVTVDSITGSEC